MKRVYFIPLIVLTLLAIPFTAMKFTSEVNWSLFDFVLMGFMLLTVGFSIEFVWRKAQQKRKRFILLLSIIAIFLLVWAELAIGLFGTPFAGS